MNLNKKYLSIIVSAAIFILLLSQIDLEETAAILSRVNYAYLLTALIGMMLIMLLLRVLVWKLLLEINNGKTSFKELLKAYLIGYPFSIITPGGLGIYTSPLFLKKTSKRKSATALIIAKLAESLNLIILAIFYYLTILSDLLPAQYINIIYAFIILGAVIAAMLYNKKIFTLTLRQVNKILVKYFHKDKIKINKVYDDLQNLVKNKRLIIILAITMITWLLNFYLVKILFQLFGETIKISYVTALQSITMLAAMIPVTLSGIGVQEASAVYLFTLIGVKPEITFSVQLIILVGRLLLGLTGVITYLIKLKNP